MLRLITAILLTTLIGFSWFPVSKFVDSEKERYSAYLCDSFTIGLTKDEIKKKYGMNCKVDSGDIWVCQFGKLVRFPKAGSSWNPPALVYLHFKDNVCVKTTSTIRMKQHDRLFLSLMVLKRKHKPGPIGHSEKTLAKQFGGAPTLMGYPEQSLIAKRSFGLVIPDSRAD